MHTAAAVADPPTLAGYSLGDLIGRGSTATVWAASDRAGRDLAIKVVPVGVGDSEGALALELSALAVTGTGLEHLVTVHEVIGIADPEPALAIVMDRVRHGTVHDLVTTRGHLHPGEVVTLLAPVAVTAARLHSAAVVHGDLSAANVGLDSRGRPVILDLGVSAVIGMPREEVYGTPGFVAPEVVAGQPVTPSADVYAMGALGWYALTGAPPPLPADRPELTDLVPEVPAEMAAALEQALHPDPSARCSAGELATAVYESATAVPITPSVGTTSETMLTHRVRELARSAGDAGSARSRRDRREELRSRTRAAHLRIIATLILALVLGGAGAAVAASGRGADRAPAPAANPSPTTATVADQTPPPAPATPAPSAEQILADLVAARASAWESGDPQALTDVFADGSAALEQDVALLDAARDGGHRYVGLRFAVEGTRLLEESTDRMRIAATVTTGAYAVRTESAAGTSVEERGTRSDPVEFVLTREAPGPWRIAEIRQ